MKDGGAEVRPERLHPRRGRLLHRPQRPDAELPVQQLDDRSSITTRTPSRHAGLDPEKAPADLARSGWRPPSSRPAGHQCPFTTGVAELDAARELLGLAQHARIATKNNGFGGLRRRAWSSTRPLQVQPLREPGQHGRSRACSSTRAAADKPTPPFSSGECAMIIGSSALLRQRHSATPSSRYGTRPCPTTPDVQGAPQNTIIGGASLWVMAGKKAAEYKGVAAFFAFLSRPKVQSESHQAHRLPAHHHRRLQADREAGLLQGEPRHRRRRERR